MNKELVDFIVWWENNKEAAGTEKIEKLFQAEIPRLLYPLLNKFYVDNQMKNFDVDYQNEIRGIFENYEQYLSSGEIAELFVSKFSKLVSTIKTLESISSRLDLLEKFQEREDIKAQAFTVPIFSDLLNYSYSDILDLFICFQEKTEQTEQNNVSLTQKINYLSGGKRTISYAKLIEIVNHSLRNAMAHGKVVYGQDKLMLTYAETVNKVTEFVTTEFSYFQLKDEIQKFYDCLTAMLYGWLSLCARHIAEFEKKINSVGMRNLDKDVIRLAFSTLENSCESIETINILGNEDDQQLNFEFTHPNLSVNERLGFALYVAIYGYKLFDNDFVRSIYVSFYASRTMNSFLLINVDIIKELISEKISLEQAVSKIIADGGCMMFEPNTEVRNETLDSFKGFSDIKGNDYTITDIYDSSLEDKKRMIGDIYIEESLKKKQLEKMVIEAVSKLVTTENFGNPKDKVKYGKMEADIVFLSIYKKKYRRGKHKEQFETNENFIGLVQYDKDKHFPIKDIALRGNLKKQRIGNYEFSWNPNVK
ncbi:MAG: hypothetical protein LBI13_02055 [Streptococcaceae bacterium]|jgi:hypothetical protein|nr:hypothetical protein [Streptococcaceae bacterium]